MGSVIETPFGPPVAEVALPRAPLVFVVVQARFERVASISSESFIGGFQEAIRDTYPVMNREQQAGILLGPSGPIGQPEGVTAWRFAVRPDDWQVTLASDFVALSTTRYTSRRDLIGRLGTVLAAAHANLKLRYCDRLGVRYVDRVAESGLLARLPELIRSEVLGASAVFPGETGVEQVHCTSDSVFRVSGSADLHARWGLMPPQTTFDPTIEASEQPSWVLDLDAYTRERRDFMPSELTTQAESLCERVYRFFRWAVTDEFLVAHGGRVQ